MVYSAEYRFPSALSLADPTLQQMSILSSLTTLSRVTSLHPRTLLILISVLPRERQVPSEVLRSGWAELPVGLPAGPAGSQLCRDVSTQVSFPGDVGVFQVVQGIRADAAVSSVWPLKGWASCQPPW